MAQYLSLNDAQQSLPIEDVSHSAEASRIATRLVGRAGFNETETGSGCSDRYGVSDKYSEARQAR